LGKLKIGTPDYLSARPLIYGLTRQSESGIKLVYAEPGELSTALEQNKLDAALIPSIEFLRGVGEYFVEGPGLVIRGKTGGILLATDRPISEIKRIAVAQNSRTPVAVLRILLDKAYHVLPDFCVFKKDPDSWRGDYDAILLTGDQGLQYCSHKLRANELCHDLGEMWCALYPSPLILSVWAYNRERIGDELTKLLTEARDEGLKNLSQLADEVADTTDYDSQFVYDYLSRGWGYHFGRQEQGGLKLLEDYAVAYQLVQHRRLGEVLARQS